MHWRARKGERKGKGERREKRERGRRNHIGKGLDERGVRERPGDVHEAEEIHHQLVERMGVNLFLGGRDNPKMQQEEGWKSKRKKERGEWKSRWIIVRKKKEEGRKFSSPFKQKAVAKLKIAMSPMAAVALRMSPRAKNM